MKNRIVACVGMKGSGKSVMFTRLLLDCPRILVYDVLNEHRWCANTVYDLEELEEFMRECHRLPRFCVRLVPTYAGEEFEPFAAFAMRCYGVVVGFEEIPAFTTASSMPREFERLVLQGRHRALSFCFTGQRFAEMPRTLTAQCDAFVIFGTYEPGDLHAIETRCGSEFRREIEKLHAHEALVYEIRDRRWYKADTESVRGLLIP